MSDGAVNAGDLRSLTGNPAHCLTCARPGQRRPANDLLISRPGEADLTSTSFVYGRVSDFVVALRAGRRDAAGHWRVINIADCHFDPAAADQRRHR